jgi:hypothetical protein
MAVRTVAAKIAPARVKAAERDVVVCRTLWLAASQTEQFALGAFLFSVFAPAFQKCPQHTSMEEDGAPVIEGFEALAAPLHNGVFVDAKKACGFLDRVAVMDFDEAWVETAAGHQAAPFSMRARMSSTRHAVMRGPSLTGCG